MTEPRPLTPRCREMLEAIRANDGECKRLVRGWWEVAGRRFHAFTGDALANRGLLEHFVREHDGNHYDRYALSESDERATEDKS